MCLASSEFVAHFRRQADDQIFLYPPNEVCGNPQTKESGLVVSFGAKTLDHRFASASIVAIQFSERFPLTLMCRDEESTYELFERPPCRARSEFGPHGVLRST
jgi:hypothetical protein